MALDTPRASAASLSRRPLLVALATVVPVDFFDHVKRGTARANGPSPEPIKEMYAP